MNYRMVLRKSDARILEKEWVDLTCTVLWNIMEFLLIGIVKRPRLFTKQRTDSCYYKCWRFL